MYPSYIGQLLHICNAALKCVFGAYSWYQLFVVQYTGISYLLYSTPVSPTKCIWIQFWFYYYILFSATCFGSSEPSAGKKQIKEKA